jgi:hypothetical protein
VYAVSSYKPVSLNEMYFGKQLFVSINVTTNANRRKQLQDLSH